MSDLTTTSYAVLGLLALRPWTTYELAQQMGRSLRNFWPRAQSKLYEEPKKLVQHGLAEATKEHVGRRPRTVYSITPEGRKALRQWLETPGAGPSLEFEALLKVFFADQGSKNQLLANIKAIREGTEQRTQLGNAFLREYLQTGGPFPERMNIIVLMVHFLAGFEMMLHEWAGWALQEVERWPDMHAEPNREALRLLLERSETHVAGD